MNYILYCNGSYYKKGSFRPDLEEEENHLVKIYPQHADQIVDSFGGAVTDSTGYVFSLMKEKDQETLLNAYFGENGLNYRLLRVPIDSCDFSLEQYEAAPDGDPSHFELKRPLRYILPMLEAIRKKKPGIRLMLAPWSPPKLFKDNHQRHGGGKCLPKYYSAWAEYICCYIKALVERGFVVSCISLQNEPHAIQTWDSCIWTAEEEKEFLVNHIKPALIRNGFSDIEVYIWDHNKERILDRALCTLDEEGRKAADGIAFHWYSGDHFDALRKVHALFPEKKLLLSENSFEYRFYDEEALVHARTTVAHEFIGDLESGANSILDWNMVLDKQGGPNYVGNYCCAPFLYEIGNSNLQKQPVYDALWHFTHFIPNGSKRILSTSFSRDVEKTAFLRPDGSVVLILQNCTERKKISININDFITEVEAPVETLMTMEISI